MSCRVPSAVRALESGDGTSANAMQRKGTAVNNDDMILISVDDHIIEPPDMFKNHLAAQVPR